MEHEPTLAAPSTPEMQNQSGMFQNIQKKVRGAMATVLMNAAMMLPAGYVQPTHAQEKPEQKVEQTDPALAMPPYELTAKQRQRHYHNLPNDIFAIREHATGTLRRGGIGRNSSEA